MKPRYNWTKKLGETAHKSQLLAGLKEHGSMTQLAKAWEVSPNVLVKKLDAENVNWRQYTFARHKVLFANAIKHYKGKTERDKLAYVIEKYGKKTSKVLGLTPSAIHYHKRRLGLSIQRFVKGGKYFNYAKYLSEKNLDKVKQYNKMLEEGRIPEWLRL